ncbi:hypothetical protein CNR22_19845 [Sphingobacteriaceae bacterium]|nr:hypothetical protein CNR22_19845 [Sphingobacteriaceae bacterium]
MENNSISKTLSDYAAVLNSAKADLIPSFYTKEARFMPEGVKTLHPGLLRKAGENNLSSNKFAIEYSVVNVTEEGSFAFVEAIAHTSSLDTISGKTIKKSSRDFFVLKNEDTNWKIHRYIFNNVEST